jgi:hypothetical protein
MAGAGKKTFVAGDVLTASDVNSYLMDQSVMRFATASARSSALPSPSEGMVVYLDSTNAVEVYDGSSWVSVAGDEIPFAQYATRVIAPLGFSFGPGDGITTAATITFPTGRFSVAPICFTTPISNAAGSYRLMYTPDPSASAVTVYVTNANISASVASVAFALTAIQMTSGSAAG